ncbi:hypothetical protein [Actinomadura coerulea]|uniref:hypothetical protein n=1 Tax=Actinomadura coerulea TaxID=46159 RepID=UPI003430B2A1
MCTAAGVGAPTLYHHFGGRRRGTAPRPGRHRRPHDPRRRGRDGPHPDREPVRRRRRPGRLGPHARGRPRRRDLARRRPGRHAPRGAGGGAEGGTAVRPAGPADRLGGGAARRVAGPPRRLAPMPGS